MWIGEDGAGGSTEAGGLAGGGEVAPVLREPEGRVLPVVSRRKSLWVAVGLRCRRLSDVARR